MDWQPIETAPKDGKNIIILDNHEFVYRARWYGEGWCIFGSRLPVFTDFEIMGWTPFPEAPK